jgi:quinol monooxygenase YgiN
MIIRIVKMIFLENKVDEFTDLFELRKRLIRNTDGCSHLELWRDTDNNNIFFTCSHWQSAADLEHYRTSAFFKDTWAKTKPLFAVKAEAWTVVKADS